jgi:hypothetical protein
MPFATVDRREGWSRAWELHRLKAPLPSTQIASRRCDPDASVKGVPYDAQSHMGMFVKVDNVQ